MRNIFKLEAFRPHQQEAVDLMLRGENLFAALPTGHGKSLCYQLPAVVQQAQGATLVISPLVALMRDQVEHMEKLGVAAACLHCLQSPEEARAAAERCRPGGLALLYISPEKLRSEGFYQRVRGLSFVRMVVDEAHCISTWGHDFRASYMKIPEARARLGHPPLAAFTATAPVYVRDDVLSALQIREAPQIIADVDRPNLRFRVEIYESLGRKQEALLKLLKAAAGRRESTIVYCARTRTAAELSELAASRRISNRVYHAQLPGEERGAAQTMFCGNLTPVLFATNAFGMGIDKPDIRNVIHFEVPGSLEAYYQEAGRAGRDGAAAECVLMYQPHDIFLQRSFVAGSNPSLDFIRQIYFKIWNWVPAPDRAREVPIIRFYEPSFMESFDDSNPQLQSKAAAALAALEEHSVIERSGGRLAFLVKGDVPISEEILRTKHAHDQLRFRIMLHYATAGEDCRALILDHFRHNTLQEKVADTSFGDYMITPWEDHLCMLTALSRSDFELSRLSRELRTPPKDRKKTPAEWQGRLEHLLPREVRIEIEHAAALRLLRLVPLGAETYVSLSPEGAARLQGAGVKPKAIQSYAELRSRICSAEAKEILKTALGGWFETEQMAVSGPEGWWDSLRMFARDRFRVLDRTVTGAELVSHYMHRSYARAKGGNPILTDAKLLLNYLFDNRIKTDH